MSWTDGKGNDHVCYNEANGTCKTPNDPHTWLPGKDRYSGFCDSCGANSRASRGAARNAMSSGIFIEGKSGYLREEFFYIAADPEKWPECKYGRTMNLPDRLAVFKTTCPSMEYVLIARGGRVVEDWIDYRTRNSKTAGEHFVMDESLFGWLVQWSQEFRPGLQSGWDLDGRSGE